MVNYIIKPNGHYVITITKITYIPRSVVNGDRTIVNELLMMIRKF